MLNIIRSGQYDERCREFFNQHWPQANEEMFGWRDQERWVKHYTSLRAEEGGEILGAALLWQMGGVGYLSQLQVVSACRGSGIGSRLVQAFERECSRCHKLALKTYKDSASQRFYERLGYTVEAVVEQDIHGIDWVYMRKEGAGQ